MLDAILTMIGHVVIPVAPMLLVVFEAVPDVGRRRGPTEPSEASNEPVGETGEELAAAIGAISLILGAGKSKGVSAWSHIDRTVVSPWKIASKSRRIPHGRG